ncbi:ADP-ribosylglycohydrolase family protein [Hymenobacter nivis]|uniref:ADP-ribosylglycohydrolase family protein n=1 Tax=Hymenobacter nivis TaxID=1850093 RepID=A0A2Z3GF21_9BACT|nr:ADP-ribosylglycohydrolase family protein [Hymenobacter nivis]AWM32133.1 hypothetical protein DDQ68_04580 [Hymenobacter nivis]
MTEKRVGETIKQVFLAIATADALGVPVEFAPRSVRQADPVTGMRGNGTYAEVPAGHFSDDTSMSFCLAETMVQSGVDRIDLDDLATRFIRWLHEGYWTADGWVFDVGIATRASIERMHAGCAPELAGGTGEHQCGNGALMRIMPLLFHSLFQQGDACERQNLVHQVCSLTHRHPRSTLACYIYLALGDALLQGMEKQDAYAHICATIPASLNPDLAPELTHFTRVLSGGLNLLAEYEIQSTGYVIHTLEAAIWLLVNYHGFRSTTLAAVNLGSDTDTTAAVVGPLAVLAAPQENGIPAEWLAVLARRKEIEELARRVAIIVSESGC